MNLRLLRNRHLKISSQAGCLKIFKQAELSDFYGVLSQLYTDDTQFYDSCRPEVGCVAQW